MDSHEISFAATSSSELPTHRRMGSWVDRRECEGPAKFPSEYRGIKRDEDKALVGGLNQPFGVSTLIRTNFLFEATFRSKNEVSTAARENVIARQNLAF